MIPYRAMLDVPRELVRHLSRLLAAERRARGTHKRARALTCWYQAMMVLVWYRKREDLTLLAAGFGISRATAYRYRDEVTKVLAATAPDLHQALRRIADEGWSHVILDGKTFSTDGSTRPPPASKVNPSTPGTAERVVPSAATSKPSCARTDYRCGPHQPHRDTCTT